MAAGAVVLAGVTLAAAALSATDDERFLPLGMRVSVHRLDARLPRESLRRWLGTLAGGDSLITWEVNDCGEACGCPADSGRDLPACVQACAPLRDGANACVWIAVGGFRSGAWRRPAFFHAWVARGDSVEEVKSLVDFERILRARAAR